MFFPSGKELGFDPVLIIHTQIPVYITRVSNLVIGIHIVFLIAQAIDGNLTVAVGIKGPYCQINIPGIPVVQGFDL